MRRVLVRLAGEPVDGDTVRAARSLAARFGARVDGVFVHPTRASVVLEASPVAALTAAFAGAKASDLDPVDDEREARARATFDAGRAGLAGAWRVLTGRNALALEAAAADLLVETRTWRDPDPASDDLFHVLGDSQSPILLPAPQGGDIALSVVAVAWGGDLSSARALKAAIPLLAKSGQAVVLHDAGEDPAALQPARDLLEAHGLSPSFEALALSGKHSAEALAERCVALGAGLVVMGAYTHSHLQESLLGGFTQDMLAERRFAVFLRH
ncbi:MAG TPA: universal stress protein [Caulobacteraceae bacterium]